MNWFYAVVLANLHFRAVYWSLLTNTYRAGYETCVDKAHDYDLL